MPSLLLRNARIVATMDGPEVRNGSVFVRDGWIEEVGPADGMAGEADEVVDLTDHVLLPGLVNTHHHLYQTLTRAAPGAQGLRSVRLAACPVSGLGADDTGPCPHRHHDRPGRSA